MKALYIAVVVLTLFVAACKPQAAPPVASGITPDPAMVDDAHMDQENPAGQMMGGPTYQPYSKAAFDQAKADGKVIFLEFHASWCATCRAQEPHIQAAFQTMAQDPKYSDVVGFKVDYDTETDLKREYGITYQHSHVILGKDGSVKVKSIGEPWDALTVQAKIAESLPAI